MRGASAQQDDDILSDEDSLPPNDEDFFSETLSDDHDQNQERVDYNLYSRRSNSSIDLDDLYTLVDPVISRRPRGNEDQEGTNNLAPTADQPITLSDSLQPSKH